MPIPTNEDILRLLDQLDHTIADDLESETLDFKPCTDSKADMKTAIEYAVCFSNAYGGVVVFGISDRTRGRSKAIHGVKGYHLDTWRRGIFDGTTPHIAAEIEELTVPEGTGTLLLVRIPKGENPPYGTAQGLFKNGSERTACRWIRLPLHLRESQQEQWTGAGNPSQGLPLMTLTPWKLHGHDLFSGVKILIQGS